jgi:hypothetical protein
MKKTLINSEKEYREYCFPICKEALDYNINKAYGLHITLEVYEHDSLNRGEGIDENGEVIPFDTPENVKLYNWVKKLSYPIILLEWLNKDSDRMGDIQIICVETVSLLDFDILK